MLKFSVLFDNMVPITSERDSWISRVVASQLFHPHTYVAMCSPSSEEIFTLDSLYDTGLLKSCHEAR